MLLDLLAQRSGIPKAKLMRLANTASRRYFTFQIPKRDGDTRLIEHPSRELKAIQRWLVASVFSGLPVHMSATAYRKGRSIRDNAARHVRTNFTLRCDFKEFFPSFRKQHVSEFVIQRCRNIGVALDQEDTDFICKIVLRNGRLTIGSPASPSITNAMMYDFDYELNQYATGAKIVYTRYADDIFLSARTPKKLAAALDFVREVSSRYPFARLRLNSKKTAFLSRKSRRTITGLNITPDRKISVGRGRKRQLKALVHQFSLSQLSTADALMLRGMLAFAADVEPTLIDSLARKYGADVIENLRNGS